MPFRIRMRTFVAASFTLALLCLSVLGEPGQPAVTDSVFLIGDADPLGAHGEVLAALSEDVAVASAALGEGHVTVVFLGDNIYNNGLPAENETRGFNSALDRLKAQVNSAKVNSGVMVYFVPGNHDWDNKGKRGVARVKLQTQELRKLGSNGNVEMLPGDGCPGPAVRTAGARLQIVFLDTQWWLHPQQFRPTAEACTPGTEKDVTTAIEQALSNAGERMSIVVAHHPLISGGPHGTKRKAAASEQDQDNGTNLHMRTAIISAFKKLPPIAWVSGHEHTLEVLQGGGAQFLLVSGAGNFNRADKTKPDEARGTWLFPDAEPKDTAGYMRLDVSDAGAPSVSVIAVDEKKARTTVFFKVLASP